MRFPARLACALLVLGLASSASASLIPDPTIGVRGIRSGSEPITNGNWLELTGAQCPVDTLGSYLQGLGYLCQNYHIDPIPADFAGITSIALETRGPLGVFPGSSYTLSPYSQFNLDPGLTQAVFSGFEGEGLLCSELAELGDGGFGTNSVPCSDGQPYASHFQFFFLPDLNATGPFFVRLRSVTYELCTDADAGACSSTTVVPSPEPAAALLFGVATLVAARHLRRRK